MQAFGLALTAMEWKLLSQDEPNEKEKSARGRWLRHSIARTRDFLHIHFFDHSWPRLHCCHGDLECTRNGEGSYVERCSARGNRDRGRALVRRRLLLLWKRANNYRTYVSTDCPWPPWPYRIRAAVHRSDHVEWHRNRRENDVLENIK